MNTEIQQLTSGPSVILTVGPSGAGKSTFCASLATTPSEIISSDHLREVLSGDASNQQVNDKVFQMMYDIVSLRSKYQQRSILDATFLQRMSRKAYYGPVVCGLPAYVVLVHATLEDCLKRQHMRDRKVPEYVVEKHYRQYLECREEILDPNEKWAGVFEYDTCMHSYKILR